MRLTQLQEGYEAVERAGYWIIFQNSMNNKDLKEQSTFYLVKHKVGSEGRKS